MATQRGTKEFRCNRCDKAFTSLMRLQWHWSAEHSPKTLKDIRTTRDIKHSTGS